ncbi:hypothetical protein A1A1_13852 [Planococcus antarcticus DSM 14505]|uniref:Uncharacterized protein n=1 Tax=Planococcus antarcticus DSM 14505 TaxID=1185653 RepID=A0AA87LU29_9BACL|nr:hypothetical protein [Planococcus antarcticus]EIM05910.1 hypothetical protein A1A1_13852 [Planococcus antarcticus DSM 14505]
MSSKTLTQIQWNFPLNNGGPKDGLNDSGVETFNGKIYESLAREIIQNSIDARLDKEKPVKVAFNLHQISTSKFPHRDTFEETLSACKDFWSTNKKTVKFFEKALSIISNGTIPVLKVSDTNTTGLTGSEEEDNDSNWTGLLKSTGNSNKDGGAGGSFGIGKNAPFACSDFRTVFYSTLDKNSVRAFQGMGKLVSHKIEVNETRGTGYFGNPKNNNQPIINEDLSAYPFYVKDLYAREQIGTDILIYGFKAENNWREEMIISILENFTVALYNSELEVEVDGEKISRHNLEEQILRFTQDQKKPLALYYYKALKEGQKFPKEGYEYSKIYDGIVLYLLEGKDLPKQVAMFRKMGMRIFDKKHFRGATNFVGVLVVSGNETNKVLREMEPAAHDKWEPSRAEDIIDNPEYYLQGINDWIKRCVASLIDHSKDEEIDFAGAGEFLPLDHEEPIGGINEKKREVFPREDKEEKIEIKKRKTTPSKRVTEDKNEDEVDSGEEKDETGQTRKGTSRNGNDSGKSKDKEGSGHTKAIIVTTKTLDIKVKRAISFQLGNEYKVILHSNVTDTGFVVIEAVGENSKEKYKIMEAKNLLGETLPLLNSEYVGPIKFEKEEDYSINVRFEKPLRAALNIYVKKGAK